MQNQIRKDYILNRWVIIAVERAKRPTDFHTEQTEVSSQKACPFCQGNESMTPLATLIYRQKDGEIVKDKDTPNTRHKDWLVRCFPNLYPALSSNLQKIEQTDGLLQGVRGYGFHEIIVESPNHQEHPGVAKPEQLYLAFEAQLDLLKKFSDDENVKYVQIFRNHRREAGASLSHTHTQIIASPLIPTLISDELQSSENFFKDHHDCLFCDIIDKEKNSPRKIFESENFIVFAPWASIYPFEFWIFPKEHQSTLINIEKSEKLDFIRTMRSSLGGLSKLLNDPPYNYGFHIAPSSREDYNETYHWHLEIYPKLATLAGFELSTGMYINTASPEMVAESLRECVKDEAKEIFN